MKLFWCFALLGVVCVYATDTDVTSHKPAKVGAIATFQGGAGASLPLAAYINTVKSGFQIKKLIDQFDINKITDKFNKFKEFLQRFKDDVDNLSKVKTITMEALLAKAKKFVPIPTLPKVTFTVPTVPITFTTPTIPTITFTRPTLPRVVPKCTEWWCG